MPGDVISPSREQRKSRLLSLENRLHWPAKFILVKVEKRFAEEREKRIPAQSPVTRITTVNVALSTRDMLPPPVTVMSPGCFAPPAV